MKIKSEARRRNVKKDMKIKRRNKKDFSKREEKEENTKKD